MSKIVLDNVEGGFNLQKINSNFQKIEDELNSKVLYRDNPAGEPNSMSKPLDMDGNDLLNVATLSVTESLSIGGIDLGTEVARAQTYANEALASAQSANTDAESATASASSAATSAATATTQAGIATTQAGVATTKAAEAVISASSAATSASEASTSASTATTQAGIATTQAGIATSEAASATASASSATTSASNAFSSASSAASSAAAAALALDNFDDRYLGSKTTAPTLDNDGNALVAGALYFNDGTVVSDDKGMYVYDGATWIAASAAAQSILITYEYVATEGQTVFTGVDENSLTLEYTPGSVIVTLNGIVLPSDEYTASNGTSVVLTTGATATDEIGIIAFSTFDIANTYTQAQVNALVSGNLSVSNIDVENTLKLTGSTSGYVGFTAPAVSDSTTYTVPATDGTAGQVLSTSGAGSLSWVSASAGGFSNMQVFTASGTFTVPAGITKVKATVVGGGGGGGAGNGDAPSNGGGGGGTAIEIISALTPASNVSVTIGAGGASGGGPASGGTGGTGGTSSFGAYCSATGGGGSNVGGYGFGGLGSGGNLNIRGSSGNFGSSGGAGGIGGGSTLGGNGSSSVYGGGGAGGGNSDAGSVGGVGVVIVEY